MTRATGIHAGTPERRGRVTGDQVADVLRRVEAGEEITVTVAGRPSVELRPAPSRRWIGGAALREVFAGPAPRDLEADLEHLDGGLVDLFSS